VNIFIQAAIARRVDKPITKSSNNRSLHRLPAIFFMNIPPQSLVSSPPVHCITLRVSLGTLITGEASSPLLLYLLVLPLHVTLGVMRDLLFYC